MNDNIVVYIKKELLDEMDNEIIMKRFQNMKNVVNCNCTCEKVMNQISKYILLPCSLIFSLYLLSPPFTKISNYVPEQRHCHLICFLLISKCTDICTGEIPSNIKQRSDTKKWLGCSRKNLKGEVIYLIRGNGFWILDVHKG